MLNGRNSSNARTVGWTLPLARGSAGARGGDCPYLPQELDVLCEQRRFNFFTMEGNPPCSDPLICEHTTEPLAHVENYQRWLKHRA
jgi:hypothetical protein